jgi:metal transporter CNNM
LRYKTDSTNKKSLSIPKDSKEQLEFQVKEAGAMLKYCIIPYKRLKSHLNFIPYSRWDFHTEEGDIDFALYLKKRQ